MEPAGHAPPLSATCRHCAASLGDPVLDLGHQPPSNAYRTAAQLDAPEVTWPLRLYVCEPCMLAQLPAHTPAEALFTADYAYFSSTATSWVEHARHYVAGVIARLGLDADSFVVEVASNDGYLLRHVRDAGIPCLGVEPTAATAAAARASGIETIEEFFGFDLARSLGARRGPADLIIGNNVLPHVPDVNDFVAGVAHLLADDGVATFEFPHLLRLVEGNQFDTIYHEHYSYLSITSVQRIAAYAGLEVFDVDEIPTHGGSLRAWFRRPGGGRGELPSPQVDSLAAAERSAGLHRRGTYIRLQDGAADAKNGLLRYLLDAAANRRTVAGYGAAAKGNTLLN
jgi:predicted TPR repeat methyltransferase